MEKAQQVVKQKPQEQENPEKSQRSKSVIWDCDSSLYDSFELQSFKRHLDSAIASRCQSMPRESIVRLPPAASSRKSSWKISRSFQKLVRSVFRPKAPPSNDHHPIPADSDTDGGFYAVYPQPAGGVAGKGAAAKAGILPEFDFDVVVRRTKSERFPDAAAAVGIACI